MPRRLSTAGFITEAQPKGLRAGISLLGERPPNHHPATSKGGLPHEASHISPGRLVVSPMLLSAPRTITLGM
jgi:hypothetical protein